ncbi:MAG: M23 family metallopeptidase [Rhizomicrobium sp.]
MRAPQRRRPLRAETVVVRQPAPLLPSLPTLEDALAAVGIAAPARRRKTQGRHGLMWRWFAFESTPLAIGNLTASLALFVVAMTMTAPGMQAAVALNIAPTIHAILNDGLPWAALALMAAAVLKAAHAFFDRQARVETRLLGYVLALVLAVAGVWIETMLGYASVVPWMLRPVMALAGGEATTQVAAFNAALVSYFEPGVVGGFGLLLAAKQFRTGSFKRAAQHRKRIAFTGLAVSLSAAAIAGMAAQRHYTGADARDGMSFAVGGETLSAREHTYGAMFAPGVPCHVSSLYGWRDDPIEPGSLRRHQGVDVAVREGTPIHAMADGRILFAESGSGLGNFTALQVEGRATAPTIVNGHMERLLVRAGDVVHRGDVIGLAGSTGRSTGPHVHLQLCSGAHTSRGGFVCGNTSNPYENWPTLAALARMACVDGPSVF